MAKKNTGIEKYMYNAWLYKQVGIQYIARPCNQTHTQFVVPKRCPKTYTHLIIIIFSRPDYPVSGQLYMYTSST